MMPGLLILSFVYPDVSVRMSDPAVKRVVSDIIRSPEDKREYRGLEFTNGLKAILISDPTTDKSSAALDVHIGKQEECLLHFAHISPLIVLLSLLFQCRLFITNLQDIFVSSIHYWTSITVF